MFLSPFLFLLQRAPLPTRLAFSTHRSSSMCSAAESIVTAAIAAVDPGAAIRRHVRYDDDQVLWCGPHRFEMSNNRNVRVVAFGKASYSMAAAVVNVLPTRNIRGIVIAKDGHEPTASEQKTLFSQPHCSFATYAAAHPVPDERNVQASQEVMDMIEKEKHQEHGGQKPLVIACISGGGSALFCTPLAGISLEDLRATHTALLNSGLTIQQMNVIRKRLEHGKGGGLQADVALILSDIIGDPLDLIASGPTVTSAIDDEEGLQTSLLSLDLPDSVKAVLSRPPPPQQPNWCVNHLVGNNSAAVQAAADQAKTLGYDPVVLSTEIEGEASTVGHMMAVMAKQVQQQSSSLYGIRNKLPVALIAGGETTVTLPSQHGLGGRNQELALAAAIALQDQPGIVIASVGTDGTDGPTDAAGAIVDSSTTASTKAAKLALAQHDAYHYLATAKRSDGKVALYKVCRLHGEYMYPQQLPSNRQGRLEPTLPMSLLR